MSFQAYLETIQAKTGKPAQEIAAEVHAQGLAKPGEIIAWLKAEYGLGHGHSMAIISLLKTQARPARSADDKVAAHFTGAKARWRGAYDRLVERVLSFGPDAGVAPAASYISLTKGGRKFAIVQVLGERLDIGVKLKGAAPAGRLEDAGAWNAMVTHRVRIRDDAELDEEMLQWLTQAYARA